MEIVGLIGGTGDLGTALAVHLARVYDTVLLGSRNREKAEATVRELVVEKGNLDNLKAATNDEVAEMSDVVIETVPYESAIETIRCLSQKFRGNQVLISAAAVVKKAENGEFNASIDSKPLAIQIRELLPTSVKVASAFQTVPANVLYKDKDNFSFDVLVASEDKDTFMRVATIINSIKGLRALHVGNLDQSRQVEGLTSILLNIAIKNKLRSPTFRVESF